MAIDCLVHEIICLFCIYSKIKTNTSVEKIFFKKQLIFLVIFLYFSHGEYNEQLQLLNTLFVTFYEKMNNTFEFSNFNQTGSQSFAKELSEN